MLHAAGTQRMDKLEARLYSGTLRILLQASLILKLEDRTKA